MSGTILTPGDDSTIGGAGDDGFDGIAGNDSIDGAAGADTLIGGEGNDSLGGGPGNDSLTGGTGNDTIAGDAGDDTVEGGAGGDLLSGLTDSDALSYRGDTAGVNVDLFGTGNFSSSGGDAAGDTLSGFEHLFGGSGNDTLGGTGGGNTLLGGAGSDSIAGDDGNDTILGEAGDDTIQGDGGNDRIVVGDGDGSDSLFGGGGNDTLDLAGWGGPSDYGALAATAYGGWTVSGTADNWVFTDGDQTIRTADFETVLCFAAGTYILTTTGPTRVEALRAGDRVVTLGLGGAPVATVLWIGRRRVRLPGSPRAEALMPIRIRAGALGAGVPHRDLLVSPDHCLFLDGVLVPARLLVDGEAVTVERGLAEVTYLHVELDRHDVLIAEGAAAESWLDAGNRAWFANAPAALLRVEGMPDAHAEAGAEPCAPVVQGGRRLAAIRDAIALRRPGQFSSAHAASA